MNKQRLAFFASGRGSNLKAIVSACETNDLYAEPAIVISNNIDSAALTWAQEKDIQTAHFSGKTHPDEQERDTAICECLQNNHIDWVVLAGYMKKIGDKTLKQYAGRIVNIHPSLLPKFGGQGMYGLHVHEAVLAASEHETGVTIHFVTNEYDQGDIIMQETVPVIPGEAPETLAARVLELEHRLYTKALKYLFTS